MVGTQGRNMESGTEAEATENIAFWLACSSWFDQPALTIHQKLAFQHKLGLPTGQSIFLS